MVWRIPPNVSKFDEAVEAFSKRVVLTEEQRKALPADARARAFWIAGVGQLDVVQDVHDKLKTAIAKGTSVAEFRTQVREQLTKAWGKDNPSRIDGIFRNATQTAYNAGRYKQMSEPEVAKSRPYWMLDIVLDARTSQICRRLQNTILPNDHPFWNTHIPPLHHFCRTAIRALRASEAERRGITKIEPAEAADEGFGAAPETKPDWRPEPSSRDKRLMTELERKRADIERTPQPPALPRSLAGDRKLPKPPPLTKELSLSPGNVVTLTRDQSRAHQTAAYLRSGYEARQKATFELRRTLYQWEWVRGANSRVTTLLKQAAIREFALQGVPRAGGAEHSYQAGDMTRAQRDLRRMHSDTQAWFRARNVKSVTLYRGVHGVGADIVESVESWTTDKAAAEAFSKRGANGRVLKVRVPVSKILTHNAQGYWVANPHGDTPEYLVMR